MQTSSKRALLLLIIFTLGLAGCGGSSNSSGGSGDDSEAPPTEATATVSGVVRDYYTGATIADALVEARTADGILTNATSDANGRFELSMDGDQPRLVVNADADGYGAFSLITSAEEGTSTTGLEVSLLPVNSRQTFPVSEPANLEVEGLNVVELGANAFSTQDGRAYSGDVIAEATIVDPTSDPEVMPGGYRAIGENGSEGFMESWGAITVTFEGETGEHLQLTTGETATIRIPLAEGRSAATSPSTIPLFFFDEEAGIWREEGMATLMTENGVSFYEGAVNHFTSWNADALYESVDAVGRVVDVDGNPVANATVTSQGQDYLGGTSTQTAANGTFRLPVRPNSTVLIAAIQNARSNTITLEVPDGDVTLPQDIVLSQAAVTVTLTWGENPDDLDSHLFGPEQAGGASEFHLYFANQSVAVADTIINLDVDDTTSFGPEVTTIPRFPHEGTYRYLVHRYSGTGTIEDSPARVEISINGETQVFSPTNAQGSVSDWWAVADIIVGANGAVSLQAVQEWRTSEDNPIQAQVRATAMGAVIGNDNPALRQVKRKYYSE